MRVLSHKDADDASRNAKQQCMAAARLLRFDESKIQNASDKMMALRLLAAAKERGDTFIKLLGDYDVNRLFNSGALYFERP